MRKFDYLVEYTKRAPFQLALIRSEEAFQMSQIKMPRPILDIGCSDGVFAEVLFQGKKEAIDVGIDIDELALSFARDKKVYQKTVKADARNLPFAEKTFATVFSNQGLEHIKDIDQVLKEANRVLTKEGKLVFLVPTVFLDEYWLTSAVFKVIGLNFLANFFHQKRNKLFGHLNLSLINVWKGKLKRAGFKFVSYQYLGSRRRYFLSEFFWPMRIPQLLLTRVFRRRILFPRAPALFFAKLFRNFLEKSEVGKPDKGPTMLIIAEKM